MNASIRKYLVLFLGFFFVQSFLLGANNVERLVIVREKIRSCIQLEKEAAKTESDWKGRKILMQDEIALLVEDNKKLRIQISEATDYLSRSRKERGSLARNRELLFDSLRSLAPKIRNLELRCAQMLPWIPTPLYEQIMPQVTRLQSLQNERIPIDQIGERFMGVLSIMKDVDRFNNTVSLHQQLISVDGATSRVYSVIYLGLGAAYFIDESRQNAGFGVVDSEGWKYHKRNGLIQEVSKFIEIYQGIDPADFVRLPYQLSTIEESLKYED